jgi:UDP-perosamine 4-acetyltransferase
MPSADAVPSVVVVGAGGHGRVVAEALLRAGVPVLGFCDPKAPTGAPGPFGLRVLGGDDALEPLDRGGVLLANGVGSIRTTRLRREVHERLSARGFRWQPVVHPGAIVALDARLGAGAQVLAGAVVCCGTDIGANAILNTRASVDHDCSVGAHAHIAPGATISGGVVIGEGAHVGIGCTIVEGIRIGARCLVVAGSTIVADVPDDGRAPPRAPER